MICLSVYIGVPKVVIVNEVWCIDFLATSTNEGSY